MLKYRPTRIGSVASGAKIRRTMSNSGEWIQPKDSMRVRNADKPEFVKPMLDMSPLSQSMLKHVWKALGRELIPRPLVPIPNSMRSNDTASSIGYLKENAT